MPTILPPSFSTEPLSRRTTMRDASRPIPPSSGACLARSKSEPVTSAHDDVPIDTRERAHQRGRTHATLTAQAAPQLPYASGADDAQARTAVALADSSTTGFVNGVAAFLLVLRATQLAQQTQQGAKTMSFAELMDNRVQQYRHMQEQIVGEWWSAVSKMSGGLAGSAVTMATNDGFGQGPSQLMGQAVSSAFDAIDKLQPGFTLPLPEADLRIKGYGITTRPFNPLGGQRRADMARMAGKKDELLIASTQQINDGAKSQSDQAGRDVESTLSALADFFRRQAQTADNIASH